MNIKMTTNSQLSTTEPKKTKKKLSKQVEQEQKWRSHGGFSVGRRRGKIGGRRYREEKAQLVGIK